MKVPRMTGTSQAKGGFGVRGSRNSQERVQERVNYDSVLSKAEIRKSCQYNTCTRSPNPQLNPEPLPQDMEHNAADELVDVVDELGQTVGVTTRADMRARRLPHR